MADTADQAPVEENLLIDNDVNGDEGVHADGSDLAEAMMEDSSTSPDPSPEEKTESTTEESGDKPVEKEGETESEATADEKDKPSDETSEESEDKVKRNAETREQQLNKKIRDLVNLKNQYEQEAEIARINAEKYRTQTVEELVEDGMSPDEASAEVQRQANEFDRFNRDVSVLNNNLEIESTQVFADFPLFDPSAPEYNETIAVQATELYRQVSGIQTDPQTGLVTQANVLPYQFYKTFAETYSQAVQLGEQQGKLQGSRATEKMMASVEPSSSTSAPEAEPEEDDVFLKGFNKV